MTSPSRVVSGAVIYPGWPSGAVITLAPFALGLLTSFTSARQFNTGRRCRCRARRRWQNYTGLADAGFGRALVVTALMTAVILVGTADVLGAGGVCVRAAGVPGRDALFWVYIATLMVPATVTVVPLYLMMARGRSA